MALILDNLAGLAFLTTIISASMSSRKNEDFSHDLAQRDQVFRLRNMIIDQIGCDYTSQCNEELYPCTDFTQFDGQLAPNACPSEKNTKGLSQAFNIDNLPGIKITTRAGDILTTGEATPQSLGTKGDPLYVKAFCRTSRQLCFYHSFYGPTDSPPLGKPRWQPTFAQNLSGKDLMSLTCATCPAPIVPQQPLGRQVDCTSVCDIGSGPCRKIVNNKLVCSSCMTSKDGKCQTDQMQCGYCLNPCEKWGTDSPSCTKITKQYSECMFYSYNNDTPGDAGCHLKNFCGFISKGDCNKFAGSGCKWSNGYCYYSGTKNPPGQNYCKLCPWSQNNANFRPPPWQIP